MVDPSLTTVLSWSVIGLVAFGILALIGVRLFRVLQRKLQPPPSVVEHRFWAFYRINDRLYQGANKRRLR